MLAHRRIPGAQQSRGNVGVAAEMWHCYGRVAAQLKQLYRRCFIYASTPTGMLLTLAATALLVRRTYAS